jgi:CheY-like chemotaxis protein
MIGSVTIFVVDDNQLNVELARHVLEAAGHAVRTAASGPEALAAIRRDPPDLILLDIGLPGMDGYMVLESLRNDPATVAIPVVAVTAYAMAGDEQRALAAGFDGYLHKPIDVRTFAQAVTGILEAKRASGAEDREPT